MTNRETAIIETASPQPALFRKGGGDDKDKGKKEKGI
jgi:hypothetical protein